MKKFNNTEDDESFAQLPIELICMIIHFLSYPHAAKMRLLSKEWRDFWDTKSVRSGGIHDLYGSLTTFLDHIDDCDPTRHPWNLSYCFGANKSLFASVLGNWQLCLSFYKPQERSPPPFHLSLKPSTSQLPTSSPPPLSSTFYVKTLHLKSVSHLTYSIVSSLVTNFNFLENLYIKECKGLRSFHISSPKLKELRIFHCSQLSTAHLDTPNLESFQYIGPRPWILVDGRDRYMLKDAMLDFRQGARSKHLGNSPVLLLSSLMNVTCATICAWSYQEVIIISGLYLKRDTFNLAQLKELRWIERAIDSQAIRILLSFLKLCPSLEKLFIIVDAKSYTFQGMAEDIHGATIGVKLANLEVVKIEGCKDETDENLLVESLLDAFIKKPKIISKLRNRSFYRLMMSREFSSQECASRNYGSNHNFDVTNLLNVENTWFSQLKHPHMK